MAQLCRYPACGCTTGWCDAGYAWRPMPSHPGWSERTPELPSWSDDDYRKARDCALEIINHNRHMGERVGLEVFDNAFQHAVGMLALTAKVERK